MSAIERVLSNTEPIPECGCWVWKGGLNHKGYATGNPEGKRMLIHRWLYQKLYGDLGEMTLDHLCRVRCCINPSHLEPVSRGENSLRGDGPTAINARKEVCLRGHAFDRLVFKSNGTIMRACRKCDSIRKAARKAKRRAAAPTQQQEGS